MALWVPRVAKLFLSYQCEDPSLKVKLLGSLFKKGVLGVVKDSISKRKTGPTFKARVAWFIMIAGP